MNSFFFYKIELLSIIQILKDNMNTGTVKWFNYTKGYGFIAQDNSKDDLFLHVSEVEKANIKNLEEGQKVKFDIVDNKNKKAAANIELI